MTITAITIENFKSIQEPIRVDIRPITLLFGPNSAGKSTIIQAIHYAREIFERENVDPGKTIAGGDSFDLGGFASLVHDQDLNRTIRIRFDLNMENEDLPYYAPELAQDEHLDRRELFEAAEHASRKTRTAWVQISVQWSHYLAAPIVTSYETGVNDELQSRINASLDGKQIALEYYNWEGPTELDEEIIVGDQGSKNINLGILNQNSALPRWGCPISFQDGFFTFDTERVLDYSLSYINTLTVGPGEFIRDTLRKFRYVGPLRNVPPRNFMPAKTRDESLWANGIAAWDTLFSSEDAFIARVNEWLAQKDKFNSGYSVTVKKYRELESDNPLMLAVLQGGVLDEDKDLRESLLTLPIKRRLVIRDEARNIELSPQDIGVGISQVLPVVVAALHHKTGLLAIEQPELHIHPAFQVVLGDLFISETAEKDLTFLIETHSEHLLLRLLRRVRETYSKELPPGTKGLTLERLAIYYVEKDGDMDKVSELKVSEEGDSIGRWPKGFFEERHGELY